MKELCPHRAEPSETGRLVYLALIIHLLRVKVFVAAPAGTMVAFVLRRLRWTHS